MKNIDIYPGFYDVFTAKISMLVPLIFIALMLIPSFFNTTILLDDNLLDRLAAPMVLFFLYITLSINVLDPLTKRYVKPLRINGQAVYIPSWLASKEVIIPRSNINYIECFYYEVKARKVKVKNVRKIHVHTHNSGEYILLLGGGTPGYDMLEVHNFPQYDIKISPLKDMVNIQFWSHLKTNMPMFILTITTLTLTLFALLVR